MKNSEIVLLAVAAYLLFMKKEQAPVARPPSSSGSTLATVATDVLGLANQYLRSLPPSGFSDSAEQDSAHSSSSSSSSGDTLYV